MNKSNMIRTTAIAAALVAAAGYTQAQEVNAWDLAPVTVESSSAAPESRQEVKAEWLAARNDGWINAGEAPDAQMALRAPSMKMQSATTRAEVVADFREARAEGLIDQGEVGANDQVLEAREAYNDRERAQAEQQAAAAQQTAGSPEAAQPTGNMDGSSSADAASAVDTSPAAGTTTIAQPTAEQATQPAPAAAQ